MICYNITLAIRSCISDTPHGKEYPTRLRAILRPVERPNGFRHPRPYQAPTSPPHQAKIRVLHCARPVLLAKLRPPRFFNAARSASMSPGLGCQELSAAIGFIPLVARPGPRLVMFSPEILKKLRHEGGGVFFTALGKNSTPFRDFFCPLFGKF